VHLAREATQRTGDLLLAAFGIGRTRAHEQFTHAVAVHQQHCVERLGATAARFMERLQQLQRLARILSLLEVVQRCRVRKRGREKERAVESCEALRLFLPEPTPSRITFTVRPRFPAQTLQRSGKLRHGPGVTHDHPPDPWTRGQPRRRGPTPRLPQIHTHCLGPDVNEEPLDQCDGAQALVLFQVETADAGLLPQPSPELPLLYGLPCPHVTGELLELADQRTVVTWFHTSVHQTELL